MSKGFKYDFHVHSKEASACASMTGAEQVRKYKEKGYTGIAITDHFFNGNTSIDRSLPWNEKIEAFCKGYENAKVEGDKIGLDVFFGVELCFKGTDMLIYGIDKEWLLANPDMEEWDVPKTYEEVKKAGGLMIHAHPMREAFYLVKIVLWPFHVDGVEVYNMGNKKQLNNVRAYDYASDYNLAMTGGGDNHNLPDTPGGIITKEKFKDISDYKNLLKNGGEYEIIGLKK